MITNTKLPKIVRKWKTAHSANHLPHLAHLTMLSDLVKQEEKAFLQRKIKSILEKEYQAGALGDDMEKIKEYDNTLTKQLKEKNAKLRHNGWLWVTINCLESVSVDTFVKKIAIISKYTSINWCHYVFEQRGTYKENNIGKGKHCHILIKRMLNYKPSALIYKLQRGLKNIVGNVKNNNLLNCQIIGDDFAQDKIKYISGMNKQDSKHEKQLADVEFRKAFDLKEIYTLYNYPSDEEKLLSHSIL